MTDIIRNNPTSNDKITYPTMSIVGINPLLTVQSDIKDGNSYLTNTIVNGKLCNENDKDSTKPYKEINGNKENINEECRIGGVFQKVPLIDRIVQKFGGTNEDYENKFKNKDDSKLNTLKEMLSHPNYSKTICNAKRNKRNSDYEYTVLPYNYDNIVITDNIYKRMNVKLSTMIDYSNPLDRQYYANDASNVGLNDCTNFYKFYCEKINSDLKEKFGKDFRTSMLGEYEPQCKCYQDLYKDYLSLEEYYGLSGNIKDAGATGLTAEQTLTELLNNGSVMIDPLCSKDTIQGTEDFNYYAPKDWRHFDSVNMTVCSNSMNVKNNQVKATNDAKINFNQNNSCQTKMDASSKEVEDPDDNTKKPDNSNNKTNTNNNEYDNDEDDDNKTNTNKNNNKTNNTTNTNSSSNTTNTNTNSSSETTNTKQNSSEDDNTLLYAGLGGSVSLCCCCIIMVIVFIMMSKKK